jgi:putative peptidoglycan lipid II flippase
MGKVQDWRGAKCKHCPSQRAVNEEIEGKWVIMEFNRYIRRFFSGTFLSRMSGFARDLAMAFAFGDHPSVAAFMVAFRFSNLFRRLLGEGPFQSVFIPHYEEIRIKDAAGAKVFFQQLALWLTVLLLAIVCFSEMILTALGHLGGFSENSREILILCRWMVPGLLFICLYGLNISLLSCHGCFFTASFAPFFCNLIWAGGALALQFMQEARAMLVLAQVVTVGFVVQWLFTLPLTLKILGQSRSWPFSLKKIPQEVKRLGRSLGYGVIGVGATQINALLDSLFARAASVSGPVYLWYSIRIEQLILAIFGIACVSTIAPALSRAIKSEQWAAAKEYYGLSMRRILAMMIPCTFALICLGAVSIHLLYGRGHFSDHATVQTTRCLWAYALGLVPTTLVILASTVFYAQNDFKTPLRASVLTVLCNICLNALFVFGIELGATSTALATSACAWINWGILQVKMRGWPGEEEGMKPVVKLCLLSGLSFAVVVGLEQICFDHSLLAIIKGQTVPFARDLSSQILPFVASFCTFVATLFVFAKIFQNRDLLAVFALFSSRVTQRKSISLTSDK